MRMNGWVLVGRKGCDYYFCDSVFDHGDGFQGATGSIVCPVSSEEYEWASDPENVAERVEDYYNELYDRKNSYDPHDSESLDDFVKRAIAVDGINHIMFDGSDHDDASDSFTELGIEHKYTDCSGGGRIFGSFGGSGYTIFDEVYNHEALVAIVALEEGRVSADYAAKVVFNN